MVRIIRIVLGGRKIVRSLAAYLRLSPAVVIHYHRQAIESVIEHTGILRASAEEALIV